MVAGSQHNTMQVILHPAHERGVGEHEWLHTRFSFSFADWYDPHKMGFGVLRVINDDVIDPHSGFGRHPHANMEIITIVREGEVSHEDSIGNAYTVPAGDIQVMSAGTGIVHAEFNKGDTPLKLFQIWIEPREKNIKPRYSQKSFEALETLNKIDLLVSGDDSEGVLHINQDAFISRLKLESGVVTEYALKVLNNGVYIFVIEGSIRIGGDFLSSRDAIGITDISSINLVGVTPAEILIFEVPMISR